MRVLLLLLLFPVILQAQEKFVTIRAMSLGNDSLPETFLAGKEGFQAVRFSDVQPSEPFRALARDPLPVFYSIPEKKEGEEIKPDALVKLPATNQGILLLGWESGEKRQFVALPDNLKAGAKADNWLLVNATADNIAFQLGKDTKPTLVKPGSSITHRVSVPLGKGATVIAARIRGEESKVIFSTYWQVYDEERCVIIFAQDGENIRVRQIADVTSVSEKPEE